MSVTSYDDRRPAAEVFTAEDDDPVSVGLDPAFVLPRRISMWAETDPDRPFLEEVTGRALTYGETWRAVRRWVTWLSRDLGVKPGDRVLTLLPSSIDFALCWLALGCIGALEVAVNPELRGPFLSHIVNDSGPSLALVRPELAPMLSEYDVPVVVVDRDVDPTPPNSDVEVDVVEWPRPADAACVIYTSGTTGPAKGVVLGWAQLAANIGRIPRGWLSRQDAVFAFNPVFHVTGRSPFMSMSDVGGRVVLKEKFSGSTFLDEVRKHGCTSCTVGAALMLGTPERPDDADNPLRVVFPGQNARLANTFAARFDFTRLDAYGSTEAGFPIARRVTAGAANDVMGWLRRGYTARVVDADGNDVADGEVGELLVRPPAPELMMREYLGRPDASAAAWDGDFYRTGDAVIRGGDDCFSFVDRMKDTIRRMGENISSQQVEVAVGVDLQVGACAVLGVPDRLAGQQVLLAVQPREPGDVIDPASLYERLTGSLPRYMLPAYIVVVDQLPLTPTNKVQKTGLMDRFDLSKAWTSPQLRKLT
jgi:crotonobetaine/carnitine-CoA ligase